MDKPPRPLDPLELQEQYDTDYKRGYEDYLGGEPLAEGNGTQAWRDGWMDAKEDSASAKKHRCLSRTPRHQPRQLLPAT